MAKVTLRVRHDGGQGVVKGLDPGSLQIPLPILVPLWSSSFVFRWLSGEASFTFHGGSWGCTSWYRGNQNAFRCSFFFPWVDLMDTIFNPGFPPKPLDISDRDRSIESLGVRNGDTIIFQNLKPSSTTTTTTNQTSSNSNSSSSSSSSSAGPPAPSLPKAEGPSEAKRQKTENSASSLRMERQVILWRRFKKIGMNYGQWHHPGQRQ